MRLYHSWQWTTRAAALGLLAGFLFASGSAAIAAPDCAGDSSVVTARYFVKNPNGLKVETEKCRGVNNKTGRNIGTYEGTCQNENKCSSTHPGNTVEITVTLSKSDLGVTDATPLTEVIPAIVVQVGESTCYWYCTGSGGSQNCEKLCD